MKRNDFVFLSISLLYAITFIIISVYHTLPEKSSTELSFIQTEGSPIKPTGTTTDIEKIKRMIQNNNLSDKEALFYKKLHEEEQNKKENLKQHQQLRKRWRRGRQRDN
ncbi:MAG TPA: hypothetical protein PLT82_00140 [Candidatus Hydrogenedens sp.]|nr:hypothetical protein [Candidatus Hydrogenedens sp.]HOK08714.1 hypothetical protein [Candidatus Hydrogenedens sp.]HOL18632.1 hypothetical protein [Candidatus Hydrogenedens sp.]HPP57522.1 hypothetical protein [Candidatus Hydrogenedens sp.]